MIDKHNYQAFNCQPCNWKINVSVSSYFVLKYLLQNATGIAKCKILLQNATVIANAVFITNASLQYQMRVINVWKTINFYKGIFK